MRSRLRLLAILVLFFSIWETTPVVQAQNPYPDCPPNSTTIWVNREQHADPFVGPHVVQINFEQGQSWDPYESRWLNNYLAGVLEGEIGGTLETPLSEWHTMAAQAMAVAARTVAYDWCGAIIVNGHRGVDDYSRQHYWPGHAAARASEYRGFVQNTSGQYLTYNGMVFDLQYRKYVGQQTYNRDPNGPHKGIFDPVSSPNEYSGTGMGVHSANHWAEGQHNAVGCEGGTSVGCDGTSISRWEPNLQWDYKRILAHYYTAVEFEGFSEFVPTYHRWNILNTSMNGPVLPTGVTFQVDVRLQNTSTEPFDDTASVRHHRLLYTWYQSDGTTPVGLSGTKTIPVPIQPGEDVTVTVSVNTPSSPGTYVLRWDMEHQECTYTPGLQYECIWTWDTFSENGWPPQDQIVDVHLFPYSSYIPMTMKNNP